MKQLTILLFIATFSVRAFCQTVNGLPVDKTIQVSVSTVVGPQGDTGPAGPVGSIGPAGPIGPVGPQGEQGNKGDQGIQGIQGLIGPVGPVGPQGDTGPQGIQGLIGPVGPVGPSGDEGAGFTNQGNSNAITNLESFRVSYSYITTTQKQW